MALRTIIKENPLKTAASLVSLLTVIVTTAFAVDSQYVRKETLKEVQQRNAEQLDDIQKNIKLNDLQAEKRYLKQQILTVKSKDRMTNTDKAQLEEWQQDLDVVNKRIVNIK